MLDRFASPVVPLPKRWRSCVRSAVLHVVALARLACGHASGWASGSINPRVRFQAELDRARQEIVLLREELRIKDARMNQIPAHRRPRYPPTDRMAILELKAARGRRRHYPATHSATDRRKVEDGTGRRFRIAGFGLGIGAAAESTGHAAARPRPGDLAPSRARRAACDGGRSAAGVLLGKLGQTRQTRAASLC